MEPTATTAPNAVRESTRDPEEAELLAGLRTGDDAAYERLLRLHSGRMLAVARRFVGSEEDARDAVQEAFVSAFKAKYGKYPSFYSAGAYDTVMLLDHAIRKAGGIKDRAKLRAAMRAGDFPTVRGNFKFNNNHFPVMNIYSRVAVKNDAGEYVTKTRGVILPSHGDAYAKNCKMKW